MQVVDRAVGDRRKGPEQEYRYEWVVDADIKGFFDNVTMTSSWLR